MCTISIICKKKYWLHVTIYLRTLEHYQCYELQILSNGIRFHFHFLYFMFFFSIFFTLIIAAVALIYAIVNKSSGTAMNIQARSCWLGGTKSTFTRVQLKNSWQKGEKRKLKKQKAKINGRNNNVSEIPNCTKPNR